MSLATFWVILFFLAGLLGLCFVPAKWYHSPGLIVSRVAINFNLPFAKHPVFRSQYDANTIYNDNAGEIYYGEGGAVRRSDLSGNIRILSLKLTLKLIPEHWLAGIGQGQFPELFNTEYRKLISENLDIYDRLYYANTHNTFLSYLVEMGVFVGIPLILFIFFIFLRLCRLTLKDNSYLLFLALFTVTVCWCQFIDVSRDRVFYIITALCWSIAYLHTGAKVKSD